MADPRICADCGSEKTSGRWSRSPGGFGEDYLCHKCSNLRLLAKYKADGVTCVSCKNDATAVRWYRSGNNYLCQKCYQRQRTRIRKRSDGECCIVCGADESNHWYRSGDAHVCHACYDRRQYQAKKAKNRNGSSTSYTSSSSSSATLSAHVNHSARSRASEATRHRPARAASSVITPSPSDAISDQDDEGVEIAGEYARHRSSDRIAKARKQKEATAVDEVAAALAALGDRKIIPFPSSLLSSSSSSVVFSDES